MNVNDNGDRMACRRRGIDSRCGPAFGRVLSGFLLSGALFIAPAVAGGVSPGSVETLIFVRHGEKPAEGLGQISCQGLNRALALPAVLIGRYGKPAAIYAPNPAQVVHDPGGDFNYIRPLATIEPTAILLGMPVNTRIGFEDIGALEEELVKPDYRAATVFIAWEHRKIEELAIHLLTTLGATDHVPRWESRDFDSIYVVRLISENGKRIAKLTIEHENLGNLSGTCP